jgi:hypothetical protein
MPPFPAILLTLLAAAGPEAAPQINPLPRATRSETVLQWSFDGGTDGWAAEHEASLSAADGLLAIQSTGDDPYIHRPTRLPGGPLAVQMRIRRTNAGNGAVYWTSDRSPRRGEDKVAIFRIADGSEWQEVTAPVEVDGTLTDLRIDPGTTPGRFEIDWLRLIRRRLHPLTIERVDVTDRQVRFTVRNHDPEPIRFAAGDEDYTIAPGATLAVDRATDAQKPIEAVSIGVVAEGLFNDSPLVRTVFVHHAAAETEWIEKPLGEFTLQVARDGSLARLRREGRLAGVLGPLVHCDGRIPAMTLVQNGPAIRFHGEGISVALTARGDELDVAIQSDRPCRGPAVRALGSLEQGLLAGLEYLGKGERSSTKLDVETDEHLRFAPDPLKVTMPLMALVTDCGSLAMTWSDMQLQPIYAVPNFFDGTDDQLMSLAGTKIEATIRAADGPLEEAIAWAVQKHGLPPLPDAPRSDADEIELCLRALGGPLRTEEGWGHCVESRWERRPFSDMASTVWRLTGRLPEFPKLVVGGAHVRNDAVYFVTGKVDEWKRIRGGEVRGILARQQPDGSFRYNGEFARGHLEDTASGVCARPAAVLLEYAHLTGDREALAAGVRTLDYMKRFRTPRGAQVWEVPLHTPDQLASAYLVWAYVRGYELTGKPEYLAEARRWALSGVPFVYLWSRYPVMLYATPPVFGATNWRAPCWIGLPVQWVGLVYAYGLAMLAPYDDSLDWAHLARGILISGQQMQYPDGDYAGLLPDAFSLPDQQRRPWTINPCALVSLQLVLDGRLDSLAVAADEHHRVTAPFPVTIRNGQAHVAAKAGVRYQVLIDGERIVDVLSKGADVVALE